MKNKLHLKVLPKEQLDLFEFLCSKDYLSDFKLAIDTSLALQIGHRESVDFDFFTVNDFDTLPIKNDLAKLGQFTLLTEDKNTLYALLNNVKISFFSYKYAVVMPFIEEGCVKIAHPFDVALMKLEAISGRGAKKDFIDLYFLLKTYSLKDMLLGHEQKYGVSLSNNYHLYKSLVYFNDAEEDKMPFMHIKVTWEETKKNILNEVKKIKF